MSFEGYYQLLCKDGHYTTCDVYWEEPECCEWCEGPFVWRNMVDVTNGSFCDCDDGKCGYCENGRIDGYVELLVKEPAHYEACPCCGNRDILETEVYFIPG